MKRLEWEGEIKKRQKRKNIIIRGVEMKKGRWEGLKEKMEEIVKETGTAAKVEGIRKLGKKNSEERKMVWIRFASAREKVEVMKGKKKG